jgi:hypothetical protein
VASLSVHGQSKLSPRFYGPFKVRERIGEVAYKLQLLPGACLHDVFHVALVKPQKGPTLHVQGVLLPTVHGRACSQPAEVIKG